MGAITSVVLPIDVYLGVWSKSSCIAMIVIATSALVLGEYLAHMAQSNHFADPRLADALHTRLINLEPFSADLPIFWIWYSGAEIRGVVQAYKATLLQFIFLIIFHSSVGACAVGFCVLTITMTLAVRAFSFSQTLPRRWFSPLLCLVPWIADIAEDIWFLKVVVQYPKFTEPDTTDFETKTAWCSLIKFVGWGVIALWWIVMALKINFAPPQPIKKH